MMRSNWLTAAMILTKATLALANAPPPPGFREKQALQLPQPAATNTLQAPVEIRKVKADSKHLGNSIQAPVVIPQAVWAKHLKEAGAAALVAPSSPPPTSRSGSTLPTTIAGLALSLAAVASVFAFRGRRSTKFVAAAMVLIAGLIGTWSAVQADIRIPGKPYKFNEPPRDLTPVPVPLPPSIVIEFSDTKEDAADSVILYLPE